VHIGDRGMRCGHGAGGASPSLAALRVAALQVCDQIRVPAPVSLV
jgi:hypothetical protein